MFLEVFQDQIFLTCQEYYMKSSYAINIDINVTPKLMECNALPNVIDVHNALTINMFSKILLKVSLLVLL